MYNFIRNYLLDLLCVPHSPSVPPAGSHDSIQIFRAAPAFFKYMLFKRILPLLSIMIGEIFAAIELLKIGSSPWIIALVAVLATLAACKLPLFYLLTRLEYDMRFYIITDRSLRIRDGILTLREVTLTFANIQNMKIEQGPIQRLFGIYDLVVETAGGAGVIINNENTGHSMLMHQAVFRGIGRPAELRDMIMNHLKKIGCSGLGDHDDKSILPQNQPKNKTTWTQEELQALRGIRDEVAALKATGIV